MTDKPDSAIILAAGLGRRMLPLTEKCPKPLIEVNGKPLIDYALDNAQQRSLKRIVVNVHYLGDFIKEHLSKKNPLPVKLSDESDELLETGGGVAKALKTLGFDPFFVINSDSFWLEKDHPNLLSLKQYWDDDMLGLLLLTKAPHTCGHRGGMDFICDSNKRIIRYKEKIHNKQDGYIYTGCAILHPELFHNCPQGAFSLNLLFDKAIKAGKLYGIEMLGSWFHVGDIAAIHEAEKQLSIMGVAPSV